MRMGGGGGGGGGGVGVGGLDTHHEPFTKMECDYLCGRRKNSHISRVSDQSGIALQ